MSSSRLGWLNCDRPSEFDNQTRVNYPVELNEGKEYVLTMLFHRYKSILCGLVYGSRCMFNKVPEDEKVTLVAIKSIDKKLYLAIKKTNINASLENDLVFKQATFNSLKSAIKELDKL